MRDLDLQIILQLIMCFMSYEWVQRQKQGKHICIKLTTDNIFHLLLCSIDWEKLDVQHYKHGLVWSTLCFINSWQ